ncbi:anthranilate phosphoribosyltransferase [Thermoplasma sp.]|uniref:anthranilate phosphoribosyltransferase n=1 Tax=Thermoplasma sp. TaxID=1973142 RepID=UPI00262C6CE7|nr:anthranilate phosphoribosyltransferase [Thermoplasma sp.]
MYYNFLTGKAMSRKEAFDLMRYMASDECSDAYRAAVLSVLRIRGTTDDEILGFYDAMQKYSIKSEASDIVGTGGDMAHTINVSTASAIVAASYGIRVAKFGNRSASGSHGSADFMMELGYRFPETIGDAQHLLDTRGFVFIYAPYFLREFALFSAVRKALGFPTVMNFLGPLLNPLSPSKRVIGTADGTTMDLYAKTALRSGFTSIIVHSADGMDEISPLSKARILKVNETIEEEFLDSPGIVGKIEASNIASPDPRRIHDLTLASIVGENEDGSKFIALNTAPLLVLNGFADSITEAYHLALDHVMSGRPQRFLEEILHES